MKKVVLKSWVIPFLIVVLSLLCCSGFEGFCRTYTKADTNWVKKLLKNGRDSAGSNPDKCILLSDEAVTISRKIDYKFGEVTGLIMEGSMYAMAGKPANAIKAFKDASITANESGLYTLEERAYCDLGNVFDDIGDYDQSKSYYTLSFKLNEAYPDSQNLAHMYLNFGLLLRHMNDFEGGIKYMLKAAVLARELNMFDGLPVIYNDIASNYLDMAKYKEAFSYLFKSIYLSDSLHMVDNLPFSYTTLGTCYDQTGKVDSALFYYHKCLSLPENLDNRAHVQALSYIGKLFDKKNVLDSAEKYYKDALNFAKKISYKSAVYNTEHSLSYIYGEKHNYKNAYEILDSAYNNRDSLISENQKKEMAEMLIRYDNRELESKNQLLIRENDLQKLRIQRKNLFIYGSISAFLALFCISFLLMRQNKLTASQQRIELEQKQLRAQMNPHFIFNCLNSIQHFVVDNDVKNANKYLSGFASLMRQTLENSKERTITLRKELTYLENYLSLELMRFEEKFTYEINCAENINKDSIEIPSMIIQPFIENAIRHGLCYLKDRMGKLSIRFYLKDSHLFCEIDDNGIGREQSQKLKMLSDKVYESQGMELTRRRLALVSKSSGSDYQIEVIDKKNTDNKPEGTAIIIKFPANI
jgi:tetratricopeptide (TPR) repeat protein